ncbi:hypothetical protein NHQ30_001500 [Ciborinia camelliae]|nr:hypothetical protein NHQ30_001500 [Ciborinia camelliae]
MGSPEYAPLPRKSSEFDRYPSPTPSERKSLSGSPRTRKTTLVAINYVFIFRFINLIFAMAAWQVLSLGPREYLAALIFLALIVIFNACQMLHLFASFLDVTVEINCCIKLLGRQSGARATHIMDCLLASGLGIATIGLRDSRRYHEFVGGIGLAFIVMGIQSIIALPIKNPTFTLKFHENVQGEDLLV